MARYFHALVSVETLINYDTEHATVQMLASLAESLPYSIDLMLTALKQQEGALHEKSMQDEIAQHFHRYVEVRDRHQCEEVQRSMFARLLAMLHSLGINTDLPALVYACWRAAGLYYAVLDRTALPHAGAAAFIDRLQKSHTKLIPITRTAVHIDSAKMRYQPHLSREFMERRVRNALGVFTEPVVVFERHAPFTAKAWDDTLVGITEEERRQAAFIGCSIDDMRAAEAAGCAMRIYLDRTRTFKNAGPLDSRLVYSLHVAGNNFIS